MAPPGTDRLEASPRQGRTLAVLIPIFNDWASLAALLPRLDDALCVAGARGYVFVIDDGSTICLPEEVRRDRYESICCTTVVHLRCNVGHQRALATGLAHLASIAFEADALVLMDGDGEDNPADVPRLVAELMTHQPPHVVFAARSRRLESPTFRFMYHLFRVIHWLLTGIAVRVGNFSALDPSAARRLLATPDLWNHYAAAVFRSRIPYSMIQMARGKRYSGSSQMGYSNLVTHGMSAIAVFSDIVCARLIMAAGISIVLLTAMLLGLLALRFYGAVALPGWISMAAGVSVVLVLQALLSILVVMFIVLGNRSRKMFLPLNDAHAYIASVEPLCGQR